MYVDIEYAFYIIDKSCSRSYIDSFKSLFPYSKEKRKQIFNGIRFFIDVHNFVF